MPALFEQDEEEGDLEDAQFFVNRDLQQMFKEENDELIQEIIMKNKARTRESFRIMMTPELLSQIKKANNNKIKEGRFVSLSCVFLLLLIFIIWKCEERKKYFIS